MEKKEKLGFFKKMFLVMTDFRTYPFLVRHEKFRKSLAYLITLVLFVSLILSLNIFLKLSDALNVVIENYEESVPDFKLSENILSVSEKIERTISEESYLIINTDYTYEEYRKTSEYDKLFSYNVVTFVNKDRISFESNGEPILINGRPLEIDFSLFNFKLDKQLLLEELINYSEDVSYKIYLAFSVYISLFTAYLAVVILKVLFVTGIVAIISMFFGVQLNFTNYMKIGIYSYTLPLLIETVAICIVGVIKDYASYTTIMLTYVYAIYALRAIKLDAFIVMFSNKKNIKNAPSEFEEELSKYKELVHNEKEAEIKEDESEKLETEDDIRENESNDKK